MINDLWLIGIGTGSLSHVTHEGMQAIRDAAVILVPHKGDGKDDLAKLRHQIIRETGSTAQVIEFDYPVRDPTLLYQTRVTAWHDEIAARWQTALVPIEAHGAVALLVWGDSFECRQWPRGHHHGAAVAGQGLAKRCDPCCGDVGRGVQFRRPKGSHPNDLLGRLLGKSKPDH